MCESSHFRQGQEKKQAKGHLPSRLLLQQSESFCSLVVPPILVQPGRQVKRCQFKRVAFCLPVRPRLYVGDRVYFIPDFPERLGKGIYKVSTTANWKDGIGGEEYSWEFTVKE